MIDFVEKEHIKAVTMWGTRAEQDFVDALNNLGTKVFVHTINDAYQSSEYMKKGVYGVYTDCLKYDNLPFVREARYSFYENTAGEQDNNRSQIFAYFDTNVNPEYIYVLQSNQLSADEYNMLQLLGAKIPENYAAHANVLVVKKGKEILFSDASEQNVEFRWSIEKHDYVAGCHYSNTKSPTTLLIDKQSYSPQQQGISLAVIDSKTATIVDYLFTPKQSVDAAYIRNRAAFVSYLDDLEKEMDNFIIFISGKDNSGGLIDYDIQEKLFALGLRIPLQENPRNSYLAVIDDGKVVFEESAGTAVAFPMMSEIGLIYAESAGFYDKNQSKVIINGAEHSKNERGLNFVIVHKLSGEVVESVAYDTFANYQKWS